MLRLDKCYILQDVTDEAEAMARLDMFAGHWNVRHTWESFKQWVKQNKGQEDALSLKALKPRPLADVSSCTEKVVGEAVASLQSLMKECGVMSEAGILLASEAGRLVCTDEKGFSQRSDVLTRAIVPHDLRGTACTVQPGVTWEHVTLTSFLPCCDSDSKYGIGLVVPTSRVHEAWPQSDSVLIRCNRSGSTNADIFAHFLEHAFAKKAREQIPLDLPIIVCLDSGGGSWLHLSTKMVAVSLKYNLRPWFLPPWTTKGLMALDQAVHANMASMWSQFKKQWGQQGRSLTLHVALQAIVEISQECLTGKLALASWRHCGFAPGNAFDGDKLFVERKNELFKSLKDASATSAAAAGTTSLRLMQKISPTKNRCSSCKQLVNSDFQYCPHCSIQNDNFDKDKFALLRSGARSGWKTAPAVDISPEVQTEAEESKLTCHVHDLLKDLRQRKRKRDETSAVAADEPDPAAGTEAMPASSCGVPSTDDAGDVPDSQDEHDCDTVIGCARHISCYWPRDKRKEALKIAMFYVETELKPKSSKTQPLYERFHKEVMGPKILQSQKGRDLWMKSWSHNRSLRFRKIDK